MKRLPKILLVSGLVLLSLVLVLGGLVIWLVVSTRLPTALNMGTAQAGPNVVSVTQLVGSSEAGPVKNFGLTAQETTLNLEGKSVAAYTLNGTSPGPELRVNQGDRVVVRLTNKLPVSTSLHWHGVALPNAEDGVAGVTQNAIKPGETYTYSFVAEQAGTYWYHSHQDTSDQVLRGLFGLLIVEPKTEQIHYDQDYALALHEWGSSASCFSGCQSDLTINDHRTSQFISAKAGERVRLRLVNTGMDYHQPVLVGAAMRVIALDGNDLNEPTLLPTTRLSLAPGQRYDLDFLMPATGSVTLLDNDPNVQPANQHPFLIFGETEAKSAISYPANAPLFDFANYGQSRPDPIEPTMHFDADYSLSLNNHLGFYDGHPTMLFTINEQVFPATPTIVVRDGQLVKLRLTNSTDIAHPMHLHGHRFRVLTHNGQALTGSPVYLDTISVGQGDTYEVVFRADNPGLWMLHCHIGRHAAQGMDMMVSYAGISTPFTVGTASGNQPE